MAAPRRPERKKPLEIKPEDIPLADESLGELVEAEADPYASVVKAAKESGLSDEAIRGMIAAAKLRYGAVTRELREVKTRELVQLLDDRAYSALAALDESVFLKMAEEGKGKDMAIALGILLEKRQLLRGEPTHILSVDERRQMNELVPLVVLEAKRRGVVIDGEAEEVFTLPSDDPERAVRPRGQSRAFKDVAMRKEQQARAESGEP